MHFVAYEPWSNNPKSKIYLCSMHLEPHERRRIAMSDKSIEFARQTSVRMPADRQMNALQWLIWINNRHSMSTAIHCGRSLPAIKCDCIGISPGQRIFNYDKFTVFAQLTIMSWRMIEQWTGREETKAVGWERRQMTCYDMVIQQFKQWYSAGS